MSRGRPLSGAANTPWGRRTGNAGTVAGGGCARGVATMPPLPGADRSTIAASHTSGSRRSHGRAGLTAAAWRKERSYRSQQSPGTSRASLATMAMYVAKGTARWGEK